MKVLSFCNLIPCKDGAFERLLCTLAADFAERGDSFVAVFAGQPTPSVAESLFHAGAQWRTIQGWSDEHDHVRPWRFCLPALRLIREEEPDIVAVNFGNELPCLVVSMLSKCSLGLRARWIWQQHQRIEDPGGVTRHFSRIGLLRLTFDRFVVLYDGGRKSLGLRGIPASRVSVIYNGIRDCGKDGPSGWLRRELGLPEDAIVAVTVGSLILRKRIDFIIRALGDSRDSLASVHLLVVGDGPERQALAALGRESGVSDRVHFLGMRNDVSDILLAADVLVHSALAEASPYAIIESMAAAMPAVVTAAGAAGEQVEHQVSGFVIDPDDSEAFAGCLARLAADPSLRDKMGHAARARWQQLYREETCARKYCELYRRLAGIIHEQS